jgi:hypothetical protein
VTWTSDPAGAPTKSGLISLPSAAMVRRHENRALHYRLHYYPLTASAAVFFIFLSLRPKSPLPRRIHARA